MTVIYVDTLFLLNAMVDYLLLLAAARLAGEPLTRLRFLLGALLGGGYAVAIFLPGLAFLRHPLCRGAAAALRHRPDTGLLAGLWEYPHVPGTLTEAEAARQLQMWGVNPTKWTKKLSARHIFTHIRWEMTGYVVEVDGLGPGDWLWAEAQQRERLAIPSAFEKFTAELKEGE